jgi:hypothetical protein
MFKFAVLSALLTLCLLGSVFSFAQVLSDKETLLVSEYARPEPVCESPKLLLYARNDAIEKDKFDNIVYNDWFCLPTREELEKACTYTILDDYPAKKDNIEYTTKGTNVTSFEIPTTDKYTLGGKNYLTTGGVENYYTCNARGATNDNESLYNDGSYKRDFNIFKPENYDKYMAPVKNKFADIRCERYKLLVYYTDPFSEEDSINTKESMSRLDCKTLPEIEKVCEIEAKVNGKQVDSALYFVPSNFEITDSQKQIKPDFYPGKEIRDYFECGYHSSETAPKSVNSSAEVSNSPTEIKKEIITEQNPILLGSVIFSGLMNLFLVAYIVKK